MHSAKQCNAITSNGDKCNNLTYNKNGYCMQHQHKVVQPLSEEENTNVEIKPSYCCRCQ